MTFSLGVGKGDGAVSSGRGSLLGGQSPPPSPLQTPDSPVSQSFRSSAGGAATCPRGAPRWGKAGDLTNQVSGEPERVGIFSYGRSFCAPNPDFPGEHSEGRPPSQEALLGKGEGKAGVWGLPWPAGARCFLPEGSEASEKELPSSQHCLRPLLTSRRH